MQHTDISELIQSNTRQWTHFSDGILLAIFETEAIKIQNKKLHLSSLIAGERKNSIRLLMRITLCSYYAGQRIFILIKIQHWPL